MVSTTVTDTNGTPRATSSFIASIKVDITNRRGDAETRRRGERSSPRPRVSVSPRHPCGYYLARERRGRDSKPECDHAGQNQGGGDSHPRRGDRSPHRLC